MKVIELRQLLDKCPDDAEIFLTTSEAAGLFSLRVTRRLEQVHLQIAGPDERVTLVAAN